MFLPWRGADSWHINKRGRKRLLEALLHAALTLSMLALAGSRGIRDVAPGWDIIPEREGGRQSERTAQYRSTSRAADGAAAFTAEARLVLPGGYQQHSVRASAALKVRFAPAEDGNGRLTVAELTAGG